MYALSILAPLEPLSTHAEASTAGAARGKARPTQRRKWVRIGAFYHTTRLLNDQVFRIHNGCIGHAALVLALPIHE